MLLGVTIPLYSAVSWRSETVIPHKMAMADYPSSSKRPFPDVGVEVVGGNKKRRSLYQVFISHRGPETKHLLAHYIYDMLRVKGFEVFLDVREMEAGEDVPYQISEAISTSAVQIAIVSPGFGESVWCLKELVMIMQKHTDGSALVIPVFNGVEPADLRFYNDDVPFCEKFRNKHVGRQSHETMEEWKKALKELANLSGFPWDEHKGKLVELLVDRVCDYTHHAHLHIPRHVIGIEKKLVETMEDVMKPHGKVTVVSITGIGGIGKTTFAKALFNNMCSHFKRHCFVDDVKGLLEKYGILHIQKLLFKGLLNVDISISNSANGQSQLEKRLSNQNVLLVLDNINESVRPSDIFIEDFAILCPSSIVIITSRVTCNFKNDYKIIPVGIPKLDFQNSERLFCSQAFGDDESKFQQEHSILVRQIVQKCDGIPLALVLFGRHISERDPSCWPDFLEMHRDSLPSDLLGCLQITYDSLDDLQKRLFLDVAIFFHGENVRPVRNLWDDHASEFNISLDVLKKKLLIEVTEEDCFRMHDILRDLGRAIVDNEDKWNPGCRSRLWRRRDIVSVLSDGRGTDKVQALSLVSEGSLILDADEDGKPRPWKVDAFSTMPSLKMLFLQGTCIEGDLSKLPNRLEFLRWINFPFDVVSIPLKFAKVVDFYWGRQKLLWNLRSMEAPMKLRELRLSWCIDLQEICWDRKFSLLKCLDLFECHNIKKLPDSFGQLTNLQELRLHGMELKALPDSFGQLTNLQKLGLSGNKELKRLPESFGKLHGLEVLGLNECRNLERLPETFGQLKNLKSRFSLYGCEKLKKLPESFGDLQQLQNLDLSYCTSLETLPDSFGQLTNLQGLDLSGNQELKKLPESFGKLHGLEVLNMKGCYNQEMLPENFGQLKNLSSKFSLYGFEKLKKLPESFGDLQQLQNLDLSVCTSLEMLPESFGQLTNLQELNLYGNKELKKLPESFGKLHGLEVLNMEGCTNLQILPDSFGQLTNLLLLTINNYIVHSGLLLGCYEFRITEGRSFIEIRREWPITKLVLREDNPESRPREAINLSKKLNKMSRVLNKRLLSDSYRWLEELPLYPITIMDGFMSNLSSSFKVKDELTSKGGATHKCFFRSLKPSPSSSETWVAEGEHCKFKCIGAAICFDMIPDAYKVLFPMCFRFGCTRWDPICYTTKEGTSLFCMAVYDSLEEISLDKMRVFVSDEYESLQGIAGAGWVCYFLERDEDLLRHVRNSVAMLCISPRYSFAM